MTRVGKFAIALSGIHLLVSAVHGAAHKILGVNLSPAQATFVLIVITITPILSAILIWKTNRIGTLLLAASMLASLVFGVWNHYVVMSADNVHQVSALPNQAWASIFVCTSYLLAIIDAAGTVAGVQGMRKL